MLAPPVESPPVVLVPPSLLPRILPLFTPAWRRLRERIFAAVPTVQDVTPSTFAAATSHPVAMPATVNLDELLLIVFTADSSPTMTTPTGWTILCARTVGQTAVTGIVYKKKAIGNEGGTTVDVVTNTSVAAGAQVIRIKGWGGDITNDCVAGTPAASVSTGNPDPPSAAWSWGTDDELAIAIAHVSHTVATLSSVPTNYGNGVTTAQASTLVGAVISARRSLTAVASPEDPGVFTMSTGVQWVANTVVVHQGGAGLPGALFRRTLRQAVTRAATW